MKISKAHLNYWIDLVIAVGFVLSALSGLVLFFTPASGGYQGGRNPAYAEHILLFSKHQWGVFHDWSSITMIAGVFLHLVFHWKWIVCMTKKIFTRGNGKETVAACPNPSA